MRKMYTDKEINELIDNKIGSIKPEPLEITISNVSTSVQGHKVLATRINNGVIIQPLVSFMKTSPDAFESIFKIKIKGFKAYTTGVAQLFDSANNQVYTGIMIEDEGDTTGETLEFAFSTGSPESITVQLVGTFILLNSDAEVEE